jgi:hypothetical protein
MELRARLHFETLELINQLEVAEQRATPEQFAAAARTAARAISTAKFDWRRMWPRATWKSIGTFRRD